MGTVQQRFGVIAPKEDGESTPQVTVLITTFNGEHFIADAINSALRQTYRPFEILVIDDGSSDGVASVVRGFKGVQYVYQENQGVSVARNTGLALARGDVIAYLDHDDIWAPNMLAIHASYLSAHPEIACTVASGRNRYMDGSLGSGPAYPCFGSLVMRRSMFAVVGGFDPAMVRAEDIEWVMRLGEAGLRFAILPDDLVTRRLHDTNLTSDPVKVRTALLKAVRLHMYRMRARSHRTVEAGS
jgi:glycosyltransferase involved in cell wall biosynthesis